MKYCTVLRRCVQIAVIILFSVLPWANLEGFHEIGGSLFALELFGFPFADPASATQAIAGGATLGIMPAWPIWTGALAALLLAFVMGRVFCGWLCPYGFFSELIFYANKGNSQKSGRATLKHAAIWVKCAIVALGVASIVLIGFPLISLFSFPGELSLVPMAMWEGASLGLALSLCVLPLCALGLELALGRRVWCVWACPQSLFLGVVAGRLPDKFPGLRISWNSNKCACGATSPCRQACSMGVNPRKKGGPQRGDCAMCGKCVQACSQYGGALAWKAKND